MSNKITIATLNVWGNISSVANFKFRADKICGYFNESLVDIVQFQEIFTYSKLRFFRNHLQNFPYKTFKKSLLGPRGGLVTFSKLPFAKIEYQEFRQKLIPKNFKLGIKFTGKGMLKAKLKDSPISLVNTHFSPNYFSPSYKTNIKDKNKYDTLSLSQIDQLKDFIAQDNTVIATGDFNIAKDTPLYQELTGLGLRDIFSDFSLPTFHQEFAVEKKSYRIDYIFIKSKNKFTVSNRENLFTKDRVSDHIGIKATFDVY